MHKEKESVFWASVRGFCVSLFVVIGVALGVCLIGGILAALLGGAKESTLWSHYTPLLMPNAEGKRELLPSSAPVVLWVDIAGVIGMDDLTAEKVEMQLVESQEGFLEGGRVKAVLLHLNTPGGTVIDSNGIYELLKLYKARYHVPVYAYVDGLCASGGINVACAADKIYATDVSIVGSVGVIAGPFFNVSRLMEKMGLQELTLTEGLDKDDLNPFRTWKTDEGASKKELVDYYYNHFVNVVTKARPKITKEDLVQKYGAHIFAAPVGKELGFVDEIVEFYGPVLRDLLHAAGIGEHENYQVVKLHASDWWNQLFKSESPLLTGKVEHKLDWHGTIPAELSNQYLYLYHPSR